MRLLLVSMIWSAAIGIGQTPLDNGNDTQVANPRSSVAHFRLGEALLLQRSFQSAANEFREALIGDLRPKWMEVWAHINLGKIFDMTGQCARAVNEYNLALRTHDDAFDAQREVEDYLNWNIIRPPVKLLESAYDSGLPPGMHRPGPDVVSPTLQARTEPEYSERARLAGLEGTVLLKAVIAEDGAVTTIGVTRPLGLGLDENAIEAVRKWRFTPGLFQKRPAAVLIDVAVDFLLPSRQSRWHLVGVAFHAHEGVSEPVFTQVYYPSGSGVAWTAIDHAQMVNSMGRFAAVSLSFEVNDAGIPVRFRTQKTSDDVWGTEAVAVVRNWRFKPGEKDGIPVSVPTTVDMIWGERNLTTSPLPILRGLTSLDSQHPSDLACRTDQF